MSETAVQAALRASASAKGDILWRNNVGVLPDARGIPVRYGLCNDSSALNRSVKSSDLIGITRVTVTPDMVGKTVGIFTAIECKTQDWKYTGTAREIAQKKFIDKVIEMGGIAHFATGVL